MTPVFRRKQLCMGVSFIKLAMFTENRIEAERARSWILQEKWHRDSAERCRLQIWMTLSLRRRYND